MSVNPRFRQSNSLFLHIFFDDVIFIPLAVLYFPDIIGSTPLVNPRRTYSTSRCTQTGICRPILLQGFDGGRSGDSGRTSWGAPSLPGGGEKPWYSDVPGMLGSNQRSQVARVAMSACLAVLLCFASLTPVFANTLSESGSCCRTHAKHCCRKTSGHSSSGPAFSTGSCPGQCCQFAPGSSATIVVPPPAHAIAGPAAAGARILASEPALNAAFSDDALRQRPPPVLPLA